jgi:hypothetical protein
MPSKIEIQPSWSMLKSVGIYKSLNDYLDQMEKVPFIAFCREFNW